MHRRGVRLGLVIGFVIAVAGAGMLLYSEHERASKAAAAAHDLEITRDRLHTFIDEARVSLVAALASGQGEDYWMPRVTTAVDSAKSDVVSMKTLAGAASASDLDAALDALDSVAAQRAEVERLLGADMRTQASRLVLSDGLKALGEASARVEAVRWDELTRRDAEAAAAQATLWLVLSGLAAASLILVGLLLPAGGAAEAQAGLESAVPTLQAIDGRAQTETSMEESVAAEVASASAQGLATAVATASVTSPDHLPEAGATLPQIDRRKAPELRAAADLCTDFARLVDAQEMPALLERAARLLDATGFIVWIADADGQHLRPSLAHGFAHQTLARLPAISRTADNATAAAFRHAEMQVVRTNGMSPGAIVVPILGAGGCVGVMAAEVRHGREASESARALARIVAAQLGNLLGAPSAASETEPAHDAAHAAV
jgi:hypothetical protein